MNYQTVDDLKAIVKDSFEKAEAFQSKIPGDIAGLRGMSSPKIRHFLNNLCSHERCYYLEIGTYSGSTLIPALWLNRMGGSLAIDNFSQFAPAETVDGFDAKKVLYESLVKYEPAIGRSGFWEGDCFSFPDAAIPKANVFFYDGNHDEVSTEYSIRKFGIRAAQPFILVVDDWELTESVKAGTEKALDIFTVHERLEIKKADGYHEGLGVFVLELKA